MQLVTSILPASSTVTRSRSTTCKQPTVRVGTEGYTRLSSARRHLLNEGIAFVTIQKVGLERCTDKSAIDVVASGIKALHRKAGRTLKVVATVDESTLDDEHKRRLFVLSAQAGAIRQFAAKTATKRLSNAQTNGPTRLSLDATLSQFHQKD